MSLSDYCQWCGAGRLVVPDDDRCRCCIEDGILPEPERPALYRCSQSDYDAQQAEWALDDERAAR